MVLAFLVADPSLLGLALY